MNSKLVFFAPSSYKVRGWVSLLAAVMLASAYFYSFSNTTILLFYIITFFWGGELFIRGALREAGKFYFGFNAFVTASALGAFGFYVLNNFGAARLINLSGDILMLPIIFALVNFIKAAELGRISDAFNFIESLDNFTARSAVRIDEDGAEKKVFTAELEPGDTILIKQGERVPVDCIVLKGFALVDEYLLTGNLMPSTRERGAAVYASSVNKGPAFEAEVVSLKSTSRIARVLQAVKENEKRNLIVPSPLEGCAGAVLLFFVAAALTQSAWGFWHDGMRNWQYWTAVFFMILACSGPAAYMAAVLLPSGFLKIGAARAGAYINNMPALKTLAMCSKIFIDKTGTLTVGRLEVASIQPAQGVKDVVLLKAALTSQLGAENMFESALKEYAKKLKVKEEKPLSAEAVPSLGMIARTAGGTIFAGRRAWIWERGVQVPPEEETGYTAFYVAQDKKYLGCIYFNDRLRANARGSAAYLKNQGKKLCLISGDNNAAVHAAAKKAGIEEFYANMFPQDKAAKIAAQTNLGESIAMIGDGFNDILALLKAKASIAFTARKNAHNSWVDIAVTSKDFGIIKKIFSYDKIQNSVIRQNILLAVFINIYTVYIVLYSKESMDWTLLPWYLAVSLLISALNSARLLK